jgi:hypothetical protein
VLAAIAGTVSFVPAGAQAEPPPLRPVSKAEAKYRPTPNGMFACANCTFFIKPRACKIVAGDINPYGWCKFFDLPD